MNNDTYLLLNGFGLIGGSCLLFVLIYASSLAINNAKAIWDYLFDPWNITIDCRGEEKWGKFHPYDTLNQISNKAGTQIEGSHFKRVYVIYKYTHKFNKKEKLVKKYLD